MKIGNISSSVNDYKNYTDAISENVLVTYNIKNFYTYIVYNVLIYFKNHFQGTDAVLNYFIEHGQRISKHNIKIAIIL